MERFLVVVECAIEHNGKFLLIKRPSGVHAGGLLAFPGGKVEYKDGSEHLDILKHAAKREVLEEVGLNLIDPIHFVLSSYFRDSHEEHVLDTIFHCKIEKSIIEIKHSIREVQEYFWLSPDEIFRHKNSPVWLKRYIRCIIGEDASIN